MGKDSFAAGPVGFLRQAYPWLDGWISTFTTKCYRYRIGHGRDWSPVHPLWPWMELACRWCARCPALVPGRDSSSATAKCLSSTGWHDPGWDSRTASIFSLHWLLRSSHPILDVKYNWSSNDFQTVSVPDISEVLPSEEAALEGRAGLTWNKVWIKTF